MKKRSIKTSLPQSLIDAFEQFYAGMSGRTAGRRLRDMLLWYARTESMKEDEWADQLMSDMYFYFLLLDACNDAREKTKEKGA